jgi:hypothetical protein
MMGSLNLLNLVPLMERTSGSAQVKIGLIDGPVETRHPDLAGGRFYELALSSGAQGDSVAARLHGTFVAGSCLRSEAPLRLPSVQTAP